MQWEPISFADSVVLEETQMRVRIPYAGTCLSPCFNELSLLLVMTSVCKHVVRSARFRRLRCIYVPRGGGRCCGSLSHVYSARFTTRYCFCLARPSLPRAAKCKGDDGSCGEFGVGCFYMCWYVAGPSSLPRSAQRPNTRTTHARDHEFE